MYDVRDKNNVNLTGLNLEPLQKMQPKFERTFDFSELDQRHLCDEQMEN